MLEFLIVIHLQAYPIPTSNFRSYVIANTFGYAQIIISSIVSVGLLVFYYTYQYYRSIPVTVVKVAVCFLQYYIQRSEHPVPPHFFFVTDYIFLGTSLLSPV